MNRDAYPHEPEFSFMNLLAQQKNNLIFLWSHRMKLIIIGFLGAIIGALYAYLKPVTYTATLTFVVEESKASGGSLLSGLAGQFGLDLGGVSGGGGVLAGDNVQQLLKSNRMIKNTLLTPYRAGSPITLADKYAETNKFKAAWEAKYTDGKTLRFPVDQKSYSRLQDSLLNVLIMNIRDKELGIGKPDKKLSFFQTSVTMRNEELASLFTTRLIDQATSFYIETRTKRQRTNINRLQARADSIGRLLNQKTYSASAANNIMLDLNPAYPTANVGVELKERDKMMLQNIFSEIVKNLEVSRTMLMQETPTFQVVDLPELPLKKNRTGYLLALIYGGLISSVLFALYLLLFKVQKPS